MISKKIEDELFNLKYYSIINDYEKKSKYMWNLVINQKNKENKISKKNKIPKVIIQFWNDSKKIPNDVYECMKTWKKFQNEKINYLLFDDYSARNFILQNYDNNHVAAFDKCIHPAMRSDYFRMCYILLEGGAYIDADDVCLLNDIEEIFSGDILKIQALCYDLINNEMVPAKDAYEKKYTENDIYYVNNNPLIASPNNKIVRRALDIATNSLINIKENNIDIQAIAGPGNLINSIVWNTLKNHGMNNDCKIYINWDQMAISKWPLDYRNDDRNWRNWEKIKCKGR